MTKRRARIRAKEMEIGLEWKSMEAILDNEEGQGLNYIEETGVSASDLLAGWKKK